MRQVDEGVTVSTDPTQDSSRPPPPPVFWQPDADQIRSAAVTGFADFVATRTGRDLPDYGALWEFSTTDLPGFWSAVADHAGVIWHARPARVLSEMVLPGADWFPGGTLNYAEHVLSESRPGWDPNRVAVIADAEDSDPRILTFSQLRDLVGGAQAGLRRLGVGPGDRVVGLLPNGIEALVAFLATAALGAVWSSCSPDFGSRSVLDRFSQIGPQVLLAVDGYRYGGKEFPVAGTVAEIRAALPTLAGAVHVPALGTPVPDGMIGWAEFAGGAAQPEFTPVPFGAPLWVLYSSGTTGPPKPIVHSVGGILLEHLKSLLLHWDLGPGKTFLWFTTTGWMMWNFLIGGLLVGATVVLYDGNPGHPDLSVLWRLVAAHRVSVFGVSAAFVTACRKAGLAVGADLDLSSVRAVGSTGSPLDGDGFDWLREQFGPQVPIFSYSGGTDVCTGIVGGAPTVPVGAARSPAGHWAPGSSRSPRTGGR